jgi:hypothetical protein
MSRQIICVLSTFFILSCVLGASRVEAYGSSGTSGSDSGSFSGIAETQQRRASERFDIISWIRGNQATIAAQNSKYGYSKGGSHAWLDVVGDYRQDAGTVTRDSVTLGKDTRATAKLQAMLDDLFVRGNTTRSLNIDMGVEGFFSQTTNFTPDPASPQVSHSYDEMGGGLLLRPFGRSSQDSGLIAKGGYMNFTETGLWTNSQTQVSMYGTYLGAEAKLYLLPFLGVEGEYRTVLEQQVDALAGKWKMQRFTYGAFLEIYLLKIAAYLTNTEMILSPLDGSAPIKEIYNGVGFSGTFYF